MEVTYQKLFDLQYEDLHGSLKREGRWWSADKIAEFRDKTNREWQEDAQTEVEFIGSFETDKPTWFREAEQSAKQFLRTIGIVTVDTAQITLLDIDTAENVRRVFPYESNAITSDAQSSHNYGVIFRKERASNAYEQLGIAAVAGILAHELVHEAEWINPRVTFIFDSENNDWFTAHRQGHVTVRGGKYRGMFFSEGIAEYVAGLHQRRFKDPLCPVVSCDSSLSDELPSHYTAMRASKDKPYVSGPDGYSIELLAIGAERNGICSAPEFIQMALKAYSANATERLAGFRDFARTIETISPGLYTSLRKLQYGHEQWQAGLRMVLAATRE